MTEARGLRVSRGVESGSWDFPRPTGPHLTGMQTNITSQSRLERLRSVRSKKPIAPLQAPSGLATSEHNLGRQTRGSTQLFAEPYSSTHHCPV